MNIMIEGKFRRIACLGSVGLAVIAFGACDDSTGPRGDRLQPEQVSAIYRVCSLNFTPQGTIVPPVDILAKGFAFDSSATAPRIGLDPTPQTLELTYVPEGQVNDQELRGTYALRSMTTVEIRFNGSGVSPTPLLIPIDRGLDFQYQESPLALTLTASSPYNVSRADYAALSGEDPSGLAAQITGTLSARFQVQTCGT